MTLVRNGTMTATKRVTMRKRTAMFSGIYMSGICSSVSDGRMWNGDAQEAGKQAEGKGRTSSEPTIHAKSGVLGAAAAI